MARLRVLGTLDLTAPDGATLSSVLAQPKRAALLAYLALARPRGHQRRDALLALFWPELPEDRARANLSNALYFLRRSLPAGTLATRGDGEIGLGDGHLGCDAVELEAALDEGRPAEALALYAGDLLAGFHLDEAPEWERWLDGERARLRRRVVEAARGLADDAAAGGDHDAAAAWARRALELEPGDEPALRRLVAALDARGDRAGALREHDAFAARLEAELGLAPSPETRALAEAVRARDEARTAPPAPPPAAPAAAEPARAPAAAPAPPPSAAPARPRRRRRWRAGLVAALVALPISSASYTAWQRTPAYRVAPAPGRIAVLPFAVRAEAGLAHLGPGIADLLSSRLDGRDSLRTIDPTALFHAAGRFGTLPGDLEGSGALSTRFGAGQYITGSVVQAGESIQITAAVYRADGKPRARRSRIAASEREVVLAVDSLAESLLRSELTDLSDTLRTFVVLGAPDPCAAPTVAPPPPTLLDLGLALQAAADGFHWPAHAAAAPADDAARGAAAAALRLARDRPGGAPGCAEVRP